MAFLGVSGPIQFSDNVTDRINGTYYVAQNVQSSSNGVSFVPVLKYSDPDDWKAYTGVNAIVWPGNSLVPPTGRAALKDVNLRIGVMISIPFTTTTYIINEFGENTTKLIGYVPDLIDLLRNQMGFIPQVILAPSNNTYNQIIQGVVDGIYDMVIGDVTVTAARREIVSFSNSIYDNSLRIIMRKTPDESIDLLSYLRPFSPGLWVTLLATIIYAGLLICILERQENKALRDRSLISLGAMGIWYSIGAVIGYGADFHVRTAAGRLLTVGLYVISLVFVATYTANLASYLTISKSKDIISSIDDIKSGKIPFNRIGIRLGTSIEAYYLREISGGSRNYYPLKSRQEQYDSLLNDIIDASFMDIGVAEYATNNIYCNLTLVGADFDKSAFGIVIPKQWLYAQDLDVNILKLRESGTLDGLRVKWFQSKTCPTITDESTTMAMGIESLGGLFMTFGVISVLSLLFFVWQRRYVLKDYLLKLAGHQKSLPQNDGSIVRNSLETSITLSSEQSTSSTETQA